MKHDVVSIGNPLMDILIDIEEEFLKELNLKKGNMHLLNEEDILKLENKLEKSNIKLAPGGSEANTLTALSMLGHKVVFFGKVGKDNHGDRYHKKLTENNINSKIIKTNGITGRAITFITPDSERTFATHLGVAGKLEHHEIDEENIKNSKLLHITGYSLDDPIIRKTILKAIEIAKKNNVKICLDLADPNVIKRNFDLLKNIVKDYVDILIANESEAKAFTDKGPKEAVEMLSELSDIAIVKIGAKGSLIKNKDRLIEIPGFKVNAIDTTGAGDIYTAGFLYGLLNDLDIETSGKIASFIASKVVEVKGARLDKIPHEEIDKMKNAN